MYTRNLLIKIIILIFLLTATVSICTLLYCRREYLYASVFIPLAIIEAILLVYFFNRTNRKIANFFDAIRNEDISLTFPENVKERTLLELHKSMNRINRIFARAREASETNEQFYRSLISHAKTGLMALDSEGVILEINPALEKMFASYNLREIKDFKRIDSRIPDILEKLEPGKPEILGVPIENELQQLLFNKAIIHIKNMALSIVSVENIKNELDHKELDSWIRLIRVLNHEIVNTVTPISTLSTTIHDLFYKDGELDTSRINDDILTDTANALHNINEHASGLMNFVNSYRQFTRLPEPSFRNVSLTGFIREELYTLRRYPGGEQINIKVEINPDDLSILADPELLQRVFSNILINALQSMENIADKTIDITASTNYNNRTIVKITDSGEGIPEDIKDQVFVPFFSTREEGSGIGLSLSRQIMHLHKGEINIDSQVDKGTTISLLF